MDFSIPLLIVASTGTLQASGSTDVTPVGTVGLFRPDYTLATAGNIAAAKYFYIATGRPNNGQVASGLGNIRSNQIFASNVIDWYKTVAEDTVTQQITTITGFNVKCGEEVNISVRAFSEQIEIVYYNGLTETVTATAPCCDCGEVPCDQIDAADIEALVDVLIAKLKAKPNLAAYLNFSKIGTGANAAIMIGSKPVVPITNTTDISAQGVYYDRVYFRAFAYKGTPTSQDFFVEDVCEGVTAAAIISQRTSYAHGTSAEIAQLERYYFSYQQSAFKSLYLNPGWNGQYISQVVPGTFYDLYYLKCREGNQQNTWSSYVTEDFMVIVAFPTTTGSAFETVLTAALGAPKLVSGVDVSTTTTTSTSSTTTTTTSTLQP